MKILFFDTETTGLPKDWNAPLSDLKNWPRLVQLAWQVYDQYQNLIEENNFIIKPNGFTIPIEASNVHKITTEKANQTGENLDKVLQLFYNSVIESNLLVAHNYNYDYSIMGSELLRNGKDNILDKKQNICTMKSSTDFCQISGPYGYKWPKLEELHSILFNESFNAHNALDDIKATARCFWKLKNRNIISVSKLTVNCYDPKLALSEGLNKIIKQCLKISSTIKDLQSRGILLESISNKLVNFGLVDDALQVAEMIPDDYSISGYVEVVDKYTSKGKAFSYITKSYLSQGNIDNAINTASKIISIQIKNYTFFEIIKYLLDLNKVSHALTLLPNITNTCGFNYKTKAYIEISKIYVLNNERKNAIDLVKEISGNENIESYIKNYFIFNIEQGEIAHVFDYFNVNPTRFQQSLGNEYKEQLIEELAESFLKRNLYNEAIEMADNITNQNKKYQISYQIALALINKEKIVDALRLVPESSNYFERLIVAICESYIDKNMILNAIDMADLLNPERKSLFLNSQVDKLINQNYLLQALDLISDGLSDNDEIYKYRAKISVHLGKFEEAMQLADEIKKIDTKESILSYIVVKMLKLAQYDHNILDKAIEVSSQMTTGSHRNSIFQMISRKLMQIGKVNNALKIANLIDSKYTLDFAFSDFSLISLAVGKNDDAYKYASFISDGSGEDYKYVKNLTFSKICKVLLRRNDIEEAMKVYYLIDSQYYDYNGDREDFKSEIEEIILPILIKLNYKNEAFNLATSRFNEYSFYNLIECTLEFKKVEEAIDLIGKYSILKDSYNKQNINNWGFSWQVHKNKVEDTSLLLIGKYLIESIDCGKNKWHVEYEN